MYQILIFSFVFLLSFLEVNAQSGYFRRLQVIDSVYDANRISADSIYLRGSHITQPDTSKILMKDQSDTISASQVFTANQDFNGFIKMGQDNTYVKIKVVKFKVTSTGIWYNAAHGLDWRNIIGLNLIVRHDTTAGYWLKLNLASGYNASTPSAVGLGLHTDSLSARWYCPLTSYALIDDSVFISIIYTNFY